MSEINLDNPKDARLFLRGVRINGNKIDSVALKDGTNLSIESMNDEQVVRYSKDIYFDYMNGVENKGGFVDIAPEALEN